MDDGKTHSDVQQKWNSQKKKLLSTEEQDAVGAYTWASLGVLECICLGNLHAR